MAFPSPTVVVPSLAPFQCSFNSLTMGAGTAYDLKKIEGLDLPATRSGDTPRPRTRGEFKGTNLPSGRDITLTMDVQTDGTSFAHALAALRQATAPPGEVDAPFFINLGGVTYATLCRATKRSIPIDFAYTRGLATDIPVMWHATDGYLYLAPTKQATCSPAQPTGGLSFPLTFPLSFGGSQSPNSVTCQNLGDVECYPLLTITGPCTSPWIANSSVTGTPTLTFGVTLNAGDQLIVDTDQQSATLFSAGSNQGATRLNTLQPGSSWWVLPPDLTSVIQFGTADLTAVNATLNVQYTSAYSSAT